MPEEDGEADSNRWQLRFENGELVGRSPGRVQGENTRTTEPIEPGETTGFAVEVKPGALEVNTRLTGAIETHGRTLDFGSRSEAETYARRLSSLDGSLRVQAAPENDPSGVDAYLLAAHDPSIAEPAETDGDVWTFDVGANLYGALGESILTESPKPHALRYFVREDLAESGVEPERGLSLEITRGVPVSVDHAGGTDRWIPDCILVAKDGWDGRVLERYYCEIKTGDASFERSQLDAMESLARNVRVVKIRVDVTELPERYSVRIEDVEPVER